MSVDALGIAETCQNAVNSLEKGCRHVQIGLTTPEGEGTVPLPTDEFVAKEVEFGGSVGSQPSRCPEMLDTTKPGKLDPTDLASETTDIRRVPDRLEAMTEFRTTGIPVCNDVTA